MLTEQEITAYWLQELAFSSTIIALSILALAITLYVYHKEVNR